MLRNRSLLNLTAPLIGVVVVVILFALLNALHREHGQTFTITGKESVRSGKSSKYLVFTNVTTYEVSDSLLFWRWDSSDVYGRLTVGKTYRATLQGWRIPIFSMYPNILDPVEVESATTTENISQ
jgi:hypothetical protein